MAQQVLRSLELRARLGAGGERARRVSSSVSSVFVRWDGVGFDMSLHITAIFEALAGIRAG
jgi:hypothetical protein